MEMHGLHLDKELVNEIHKETVEEHISILSELDSITGGINMGSAPQVAEFIYNVLKFDELKNRYNSQIFESAGIYPHIWVREKEEALDYLLHYYKKLIKLYQKAVDAGEYILMIIG